MALEEVLLLMLRWLLRMWLIGDMLKEAAAVAPPSMFPVRLILNSSSARNKNLTKCAKADKGNVGHSFGRVRLLNEDMVSGVVEDAEDMGGVVQALHFSTSRRVKPSRLQLLVPTRHLAM